MSTDLSASIPPPASAATACGRRDGQYDTQHQPAATPFQDRKNSSRLRILLLVSAIIIFANFLIGIFSPILTGLDDEIKYLDTIWRVVSGQRVGVDYHNPEGFGPYQLGALLWHWLGPHHYVMRIAVALFSLAIACCGCIVAERVLAGRADLTLLFCVTLAFQLSAPSIYEAGRSDLSIAGFPNRLIVSTLAVLFLQTFGGSSRASARENVIEIAVTAILLNMLFLIKISGLVVGSMILVSGCLLRGGTAQRFLNLGVALLIFAVITAIELKAAGLEFVPIIKEYELAARARLAYSLYDIVRGVFSWPLAISLALLVLFAVSQRPGEPRFDWRSVILIIGTYAAGQHALNLTNSWGPSMWLAPAAAASLVVCMGAKPFMQQAGNAERLWRRLRPSRLAEMSVRDAIPLIIFVLVLVPEIVASIVGVTVGTLVSFGIKASPVVVTAGKTVSFRSLPWPSHDSPIYVKSLNDASAAISSLGLDREAIANLDFSNPFPVLFLAPPPKGNHVWLEWGYNVPRGTALKWQDVIGDACVVTIPGQPSNSSVTAGLAEVVRPKLATDFKMVHQDDMWTIYRRTQDCATAPHP